MHWKRLAPMSCADSLNWGNTSSIASPRCACRPWRPFTAPASGAVMSCALRAAGGSPRRTVRRRSACRKTQLGILPAWGGSTRLPRLIGVPRALDIILDGKTLPAKAALRRGMIDDIAPRELLLAAALKWIREQSHASHKSLRFLPSRRSWPALDRLTAAIAVPIARRRMEAKAPGPLSRATESARRGRARDLGERRGFPPARARVCPDVGRHTGMPQPDPRLSLAGTGQGNSAFQALKSRPRSTVSP